MCIQAIDTTILIVIRFALRADMYFAPIHIGLWRLYICVRVCVIGADAWRFRGVAIQYINHRQRRWR